MAEAHGRGEMCVQIKMRTIPRFSNSCGTGSFWKVNVGRWMKLT